MTDESLDANSDSEQSTPEPKWWIDEGVPGIGDRPDWMPEKFKTVKAAMDSRSELEKKLGTAPVDNYDFGEYSEKFDTEHEALKDLTAFAKEKKVPQEVFTKMLESVSKYSESFLPDSDAEKAKIGDDADSRIEILQNWAESNLSEGTANVFKGLTSDFINADTVKALEELRGKAMSQTNTIPNGSDTESSNVESLEDIQQEMNSNLDKFKNDVVYRRQMQQRIASISKTSQYVDKVGF